MTSNLYPNTLRQIRAQSSSCRVCQGPAMYSYFGCIVCHPCKMFFKRNAQSGLERLSCGSGGKCEINTNTRHVCSYCRLFKCFSTGMRIEMLRSSMSNRRRKNRKSRDNQSTATVAVRTDEVHRPAKPRTLNFVQSSRLSLTPDQWNFLSNLIHCFDEHSGYSHAERFVCEQNVLPIKSRYKPTVVAHFIESILSRAQSLYEKNQDFVGLCEDDRSILLRTTISHVAGLGVHIILRSSQLMQHPMFLTSLQTLFSPVSLTYALRVREQIDDDIVMMKLVLAILTFSTNNYTVYSNVALIHFRNIKEILRIQNSYIELLWRYLLHKYSYDECIKRFANLIRCLFSYQWALMEAIELERFNNMIDNVIEQTEQFLATR